MRARPERSTNPERALFPTCRRTPTGSDIQRHEPTSRIRRIDKRRGNSPIPERFRSRRGKGVPKTRPSALFFHPPCPKVRSRLRSHPSRPSSRPRRRQRQISDRESRSVGVAGLNARSLVARSPARSCRGRVPRVSFGDRRTKRTSTHPGRRNIHDLLRDTNKTCWPFGWPPFSIIWIS
jgi:hypothetical protein